METILLAHLETQVLQDHKADQTEIGGFELDVKLPVGVWNAEPNKWLRWKHEVSRHLASAIIDTEVPAEYWFCQPPLEMQKAFGLPESMQMKV